MVVGVCGRGDDDDEASERARRARPRSCD